MLKNFSRLVLFLCLAMTVAAQTSETLKLRETEMRYYEKNNLNFRFESNIAETEAEKIARKLQPRGANSQGEIYKAPGADENLYIVTDYEDRCALTLYRNTAGSLVKIYQSKIFRDAYSLDLKFFESANRTIILAAKREGVGDYIDTEVFEFSNGRVKYLGLIPVGTTEETTGNIDAFAGEAAVTYQTGNYRIKINGKSYIPAGKRSPNRDKLLGTNIVYVYDGKILRRGK